MPDSFRRIGRGGAGNFLTQPTSLDPAPLSKTSSPPTPSTSGDTNVSQPQPTRSGRGGAGNFLAPSQTVSPAEQEKLSERTDAAVKERLLKAGKSMASGRGGAGNWNPDVGADQAAGQDAEEADKRVQLDKQAEEAVDLGLRPPEKIHDRRIKSWSHESAEGEMEA